MYYLNPFFASDHLGQWSNAILLTQSCCVYILPCSMWKIIKVFSVCIVATEFHCNLNSSIIEQKGNIIWRNIEDELGLVDRGRMSSQFLEFWWTLTVFLERTKDHGPGAWTRVNPQLVSCFCSKCNTKCNSPDILRVYCNLQIKKHSI